MIQDNVIAHNPVRAGAPGPPQQFGVHAIDAMVDIFHNEVSGFRNFDALTGVGAAGIRLDGVVRGRIGGSPTLDRINNIHNNHTGVLLASQGFTVAYNTIHHNDQEGILASFQASANTVAHNTVTNNGRKDCVDRSTGTRSAGTANTWFDNVTLGARSFPQSICRPAGTSAPTTAAARFSVRLAEVTAGPEP